MKPNNIFQLIDFDRVLFDTPRFVRALTDEIDTVQPGYGSALYQRFQQAYTREETFFIMQHLRRERGDAWFEDIATRVVRRFGGAYFLLPGVHERLTASNTLSMARPSWGILTYGHVVDQAMKLAIVGLDEAAVHYTDTPDKGYVIAEWQQPDGRFRLPDSLGGGFVDSVTLEDDKLRAFQGLPSKALGIWITQDNNASQRLGEVAFSNVKAAQNLAESIEILTKTFSQPQ